MALFGIRIIVLYRNGAKMTMRFRRFDVEWKDNNVSKIPWQTLIFSWSRRPLWPNVDEICAVWQGR
jgi:hypothetical protein